MAHDTAPATSTVTSSLVTREARSAAERLMDLAPLRRNKRS